MLSPIKKKKERPKKGLKKKKAGDASWQLCYVSLQIVMWDCRMGCYYCLLNQHLTKCQLFAIWSVILHAKKILLPISLGRSLHAVWFVVQCKWTHNSFFAQATAYIPVYITQINKMLPPALEGLIELSCFLDPGQFFFFFWDFPQKEKTGGDSCIHSLTAAFKTTEQSPVRRSSFPT